MARKNPFKSLWQSRTVWGAAIIAIGHAVKLVNPEVGTILEAVGALATGAGLRSALRTSDAFHAQEGGYLPPGVDLGRYIPGAPQRPPVDPYGGKI